MTIKKLIEMTWLVRYTWPVEITYDQGGEFLGHEFKIILMEQEYGIKTKPDSSGNTQANKTIKQIYQVLANLVHTYNLQETYVDDTNPCMGILSAAAFMVRSTYHRTEQKNTGQLFFGRDMILPINHVANWIQICQRKQR